MLKTRTITILKEPKISLKKLCEYSLALAGQRKRILEACKIKDPAVIAMSIRYNRAQDLIADYMEQSLGFKEMIKSYSNDLRLSSKKLNGNELANTILCAEALDKFYEIEEKLESMLEGIVINNSTKEKNHKINVNGVEVTIRPEMLLYTDGGITPCGFVKLCFLKSSPLDVEIANGMAAFGRLYFREAKHVDFDPKRCIVIDVFAKRIFFAKKHDKRILETLKACCSEIADRWDKI